MIAYYTGKVNDVMNGVLMDVDISDIPALRQREIGYDLYPVVSMEWRAKDVSPTVAYILCASEVPGKRIEKRRINPPIMPHLEYFHICRGCGLIRR